MRKRLALVLTFVALADADVAGGWHCGHGSSGAMQPSDAALDASLSRAQPVG